MSNMSDPVLRFIDRITRAKHGDLERDAADRGKRVLLACIVLAGIIGIGILLSMLTGEWFIGAAFSYILGALVIALCWSRPHHPTSKTR